VTACGPSAFASCAPPAQPTAPSRTGRSRLDVRRAAGRAELDRGRAVESARSMGRPSVIARVCVRVHGTVRAPGHAVSRAIGGGLAPDGWWWWWWWWWMVDGGWWAALDRAIGPAPSRGVGWAAGGWSGRIAGGERYGETTGPSELCTRACLLAFTPQPQLSAFGPVADRDRDRDRDQGRDR